MRPIVLIPALALSLSLAAGTAHAQYDNRGGYERSTVITSPALGGGTSTTTRSEQPMPAGLATRLDERVDQLEEMVRQLTGRIEETQYKNNQLSKQVERLQADIELRFKDLQAGGGAAAGGASAAGASSGAPAQLSMPASSGGPSDRVVLTPPKGADASGPAPGPGVLGTLSDKDAKKALPKPTDPQALYDAAYTAAQAGDYATAEAGFQDFLEKNPKHSLAGNAQYWLGDIAYSKKDFNAAAATFLDGYKKFPKHPKSPDMIYKAGSSFGQMGKTKEACTAFAILFADNPQMPERVKRAATAEKKKYGCK